MANKPLSTETIALTEKKMEMSLDEIIKMSKINVGKGKKPPRISNKSRGFKNGGPAQGNSYKVQNFMDSRSSIRQGVLARRRSNAPGTQFPLTTEIARKAANMPIQKRGFYSNRPRVAQIKVKSKASNAPEQSSMVPKQRQTLDARFADMREQRLRMSQQVAPAGVNANAFRRRGQMQSRQLLQRGGVGVRRGGGAGGNRRFGNFPGY